MDLQIIQNKIFEVRGCRVMLDFHLAELYQVETRALKQAVKRNLSRFPSDFAFQLTRMNGRNLSQTVISSLKISGTHRPRLLHFWSRVSPCLVVSYAVRLP